MREVKFQCIYRPTKERFEPKKIDFVNKVVYGDFDGETNDYCHFSFEPNGYGDVWLRLFTGLYDKNGKEIYEGDQFKIVTSDSTYTVYFCDKSASYRAKRNDGWHFDLVQLFPSDEWENVSENTELMQQS